VAMEGLLQLLGEEPLPLVVQASPRRRLEDPVLLVGEQDLQRVWVRGRAEPTNLAMSEPTPAFCPSEPLFRHREAARARTSCSEHRARSRARRSPTMRKTPRNN